MTNTARQRASAPRKKKQTSLDETTVPLIPGWAGTWGPVLLLAGALTLIFTGVTGVRDGASWGWTLLFAMVIAVAAMWGWGYLRRLRRHKEDLDRALYEQSEFPRIDVMSGEEFELYCARVLPSLGFRNIEWIGGPNDGGADILATDSDGNDVAVQCKRRNRPVGPWAIREIRGAVSGGRHTRRQPVLMTNALVTPHGRKAAEEAKVRVIARQELGHAIWRLSKKTHPEVIREDYDGDDSLDSAAPGASRNVLPETMVTLAVTG